MPISSRGVKHMAHRTPKSGPLCCPVDPHARLVLCAVPGMCVSCSTHWGQSWTVPPTGADPGEYHLHWIKLAEGKGKVCVPDLTLGPAPYHSSGQLGQMNLTPLI